MKLELYPEAIYQHRIFFTARHANASGSGSLDSLDSNRQLPGMPGENSWRPKSRSCQVWLGQLLAKLYVLRAHHVKTFGKKPTKFCNRWEFQLQQCQNKWCTFGAIHVHCDLHSNSIVYIYHYILPSLLCPPSMILHLEWSHENNKCCLPSTELPQWPWISWNA